MSYQAMNATKHGMSRTRQYHIWRGMRERCNNPDARHARWYTGITYDPDWNTFEGFWQDMKDGYADNLTLDRIDSSKNYCKANCRWITMKDQARNRKNNVMLPYEGQMLCVSDYADKIGLPRALIYQRVQRSVAINKLATPSRKKQLRGAI